MVGEFRNMVTVVVPHKCQRSIHVLRDDATLKFEQLTELHGVDYLNYPNAAHRFGLNIGLLSITNNNRLWLKVFLDPTMERRRELISVMKK